MRSRSKADTEGDVSETSKHGEAPPEGRREGGAKPPETLTQFNKTERGGSGATVQESKRREGSDRANKTNK